MGFRLFDIEGRCGNSSMDIIFRGQHCDDKREHVIAYSDEFGRNPSTARKSFKPRSAPLAPKMIGFLGLSLGMLANVGPNMITTKSFRELHLKDQLGGPLFTADLRHSLNPNWHPKNNRRVQGLCFRIFV